MNSYSQKRVSRKFFFFLATLLVLALSLFFFRHSLLVLGVKTALNALMPTTQGHRLTYDALSWHEDKLVLTGLHRQEESYDATLDRAEIDFEWHLSAPFIEAKMKLIHPQINLHKDKLLQGAMSPVAVLFPSKFYNVKLDVQNGVIQLDSERFYFAFTGSEKEEKIGTLFVSYDPSLLSMPFLLVDLQKEGEEFISEIKVEQTSCSKLVQLAQLFYPGIQRGWQKIEGDMEAEVKAILNSSGELAQMSCHFDVVNLSLFNQELGVQAHADHFKGQFQYPAIDLTSKGEQRLPFWKQMLASFSLQKGQCLLSKGGVEWGFSEIEGDLALDPNQDPNLFVKGLFRQAEKQYPWQVDGKGSMHEDQSFWLELALQMESAEEEPSQGFLSLCSPGSGAYVIQAEAKKIVHSHLMMAQQLLTANFPALHEMQVCSGSLRGKAVAWVENEHLARVEWDGCEGEGLCVLLPQKGAQGYFDLFKSTGHLSFSKSSLKGEMQNEIALASDQLFGMINQQWGKSFQPGNSPERAAITTWIKIKDDACEFSGAAEFGQAEGEKQQIQFGFLSNTLFPNALEEVSSGWIRAPKLTSSFYSSFLPTSELSVEGTVDLFGTFDQNGLDCSLQIEEPYLAFSHFEVKAPSIGEQDPLLLKTEGRATVHYDPKTAEWACEIPLKKAAFCETNSNALFENIEGKLSFVFSEEKWSGKGHLANADLHFNSSIHLDHLRTDFRFDSKDQILSFENLACAVPIAWGSTYVCRAPVLRLTPTKGWDFQIQLSEKGTELAKMEGAAKADFSEAKGTIELLKQWPILGIFETEMSWNQLENSLSLTAKGSRVHMGETPVATFALEAKKKGESWAIEKLQFNDFFLRSHFRQKETELSISLLELKGDNFFVRSSGTGQIQMATEEAPLTIQAELDLLLELHQPLAIQAQNQGKVRVAYTPGFGIALSGLNLEDGKSRCSAEFLEFFPNQGRGNAQGVQFLLAQPFLKAFENKALFALFEKSIENEKGLRGGGNVAFTNNSFKADLQLKSLGYWTVPTSDLFVQLELSEPNANLERLCKLSVRDAAKKGGIIALLDAKHKEDFHLKRLSGSLAGLNVDLVRESQIDLLKGTVGVDVADIFMLLPQEIQDRLIKLEVSGAYDLTGDFHCGENWKFNGKVQAKDFAFLGYEFAFLEAEALLQNRECLFQNLVIDDESGTLSAKQIKCFKETVKSPWAFFIPVVSVQEFRPSLLTKLEESKQIKKPLVIKNATLFECRGYLDSPSTYAAKGTMNFTNAFKKEFSLFDIPLDMLKNLGLDPNLFTPVIGEVDYELKAGKFYITALRNTFSEGKRSQFYLETPSSSYLDLEGNLHFDIKLKQSVVLKIADSLTLSVRGTWERPKYSLQ